MKPFNLEEYLANPEMKVVTRSGKPVEIVGIAQNKEMPIIGYMGDNEYPSMWYANGVSWLGKTITNCDFDLFYADKEEESITVLPKWHRAGAGTKLPGEAVIIYDIDPEPRLGKVMVNDGRYMLVKELEELPEE